MSKLSAIKDRAAAIARRRGTDDEQDLGPDRGTMDQAEARKERARIEARREAERERVQQEAEQAAEQERERVLNDSEGGGGIVSSVVETLETAADAVDDGDGQRLDDIGTALGSDFDGDGETFAEEIGLQSAARGDAEDEAITDLSQRVNRNTDSIDSLQQQVQGGGDAFGGGGGGADDAAAGGFFGGGEVDANAIDPAEFGLGGGDDDSGGLFGGGGGGL